MQTINIETSSKNEIIDIIPEISKIVKNSNINVLFLNLNKKEIIINFN